MTQPPSPQRQGMPCPSCSFFIDLSIRDLLSRDEHRCPGCGLVLVLQRSESRESMEALSQLQVAIDNLETVQRQVGGG